jgi:hypothetical protein
MGKKENISVFWWGKLKKKNLLNLGLDGCDRMVGKEMGREGVK